MWPQSPLRLLPTPFMIKGQSRGRQVDHHHWVISPDVRRPDRGARAEATSQATFRTDQRQHQQRQRKRQDTRRTRSNLLASRPLLLAAVCLLHHITHTHTHTQFLCTDTPTYTVVLYSSMLVTQTQTDSHRYTQSSSCDSLVCLWCSHVGVS